MCTKLANCFPIPLESDICPCSRKVCSAALAMHTISRRTAFLWDLSQTAFSALARGRPFQGRKVGVSQAHCAPRLRASTFLLNVCNLRRLAANNGSTETNVYRRFHCRRADEERKRRWWDVSEPSTDHTAGSWRAEIHLLAPFCPCFKRSS